MNRNLVVIERGIFGRLKKKGIVDLPYEFDFIGGTIYDFLSFRAIGVEEKAKDLLFRAFWVKVEAKVSVLWLALNMV